MRAILPFKSLDAAASTGPGAVRDLETVMRRHTAVISSAGSPSSSAVLLEGSLDGLVWIRLGDAGAINPGPSVITVSEHLVRFIRANLTTLSGGSSPTITALIASAEE